MASFLSKLIYSAIKSSNIKKTTDKVLTTGNTDNCLPPKKLQVKTTEEEGRRIYTIKGVGKKTILYLHGGVYVHGFNRIHWSFLNTIHKNTGATIVAPDYPLAISATYKENFKLLVPLYQKLATSVGKENIVFLGDSSGAGLALALAELLGKAGPKQIILLSPWLDVTLQNKEIESLATRDPILSIDTLRKAGKLYAGDTTPEDFRVSPINGPLDDLGKISLFIGSEDILMPDARRLVELAKKQGNIINYHEEKGMLHTYMFFHTKEANQTIDEIIKLIKL